MARRRRVRIVIRPTEKEIWVAKVETEIPLTRAMAALIRKATRVMMFTKEPWTETQERAQTSHRIPQGATLLRLTTTVLERGMPEQTLLRRMHQLCARATARPSEHARSATRA